MVLSGRESYDVRNASHSIFKPKHIPQPTQEPEEKYDDEEDEKEQIIVPKKSNYLPGERLLRKINKDKKAKKKKTKAEEPDIDRLSASMARVLNSIG